MHAEFGDTGELMFATRVRTRSEAENPDARTTPCYRVRMANELVITVSSEKPILEIYFFKSRVSRQEREFLSFSLILQCAV